MRPPGGSAFPEDIEIDTERIERAIAGDSGFEAGWYYGVRVLAAYRPVEYQPGATAWGLVAKMDEAEAYEPVARFRRILITLVALLLGEEKAAEVAGPMMMRS